MSAPRRGRQPHEDPGSDYRDDDYASTSRRSATIAFNVVLLPSHRSAETAAVEDVRLVVAPAPNDYEARQHPDVQAACREGLYVADVVMPGHSSAVTSRIRQRALDRADAAEKVSMGFADANTAGRWGRG